MQGAAHLPDQPISHPRVRVLQGQNCSEHNIAYGQWREHFQPIIRCKEGTRTKPDGSTGPIGLGPGDMFGVTMAEAAGPEVTIGLVGAAYGGTDIEAHLKNCAQYGACKPPYGDVSGAPVANGTTPIYQWILDLGKKAQQVGVIKGIIFHHGENNAGEATWLPRVNEFITSLRNDLSLDPAEVPFIAGELPRTGCCAASHNPLVQQIPDYVENGHWVSSGPMPDGTILGDRSDRLHWSTFSVIEMGKRYAAKMLEVGHYEPGSCGEENGTPICCTLSADPDGDGVGEQNNGQMCIVTEQTTGWHLSPPDDVVYAINVGSSEGVSADNIWFNEDKYFTGGTPGSTSEPIAGSDKSTVFSSERYGDFSYSFPVTNGTYSVQFGMVEMYHLSPDNRIFNVSVEGTEVISGLDIFAAVGSNTLLKSDEFSTTVTDGQLNIDVTTVADNGTLSSILIRKQAANSSSVAAHSSSSSASSSGNTGGALELWFLVLILGGPLLYCRHRNKV